MNTRGLEICTDPTYTKNFTYGAGEARTRPGTASCQLFLAELCAVDPTKGCLELTSDDTYTPGVDILGRPIQQTVDDAYLRNIALTTYMFATPGCRLDQQRLDPQDSQSPQIYTWRNKLTPYSPCAPILTLSSQQIDTYIAGGDPVLTKLVQRAPRFNDILSNIRSTLVATGHWGRLVNTPFFSIFGY